MFAGVALSLIASSGVAETAAPTLPSQAQTEPAAPVQAQPVSPSPETTLAGEQPPTVATPSATEPIRTATTPVVAPKDKVHDRSPWGMFMAADIVVKAVTVFLVLASVLTWTVWLAKSMELMAARRRARRARQALEQAETLVDGAATLAAQRIQAGAPVALLATATDELRRSTGHSSEGAKERVAIALARVEARAGRRMAPAALEMREKGVGRSQKTISDNVGVAWGADDRKRLLGRVNGKRSGVGHDGVSGERIGPRRTCSLPSVRLALPEPPSPSGPRVTAAAP
jgi:hypothetical protein